MMDHQTTPTEAAARPTSLARIGLVGALAAALVATAILVAGATAVPSGTLAGDAEAGAPLIGLEGRGPADGPMGARFGGKLGFGQITITAISGPSVSLKTADGWTRTIAIAGDTVLMKGDATIALGDLKVGDDVRFKQTRQDDGTFKITGLHVVLPKVGGAVTAVDGSTITVTQRDGTTATIKVTSSTTYTIGKTDGKALTDVKVGMMAGGVGTLNADGSLTATSVHAFDPASKPDFDGRPGGHGPWGNGPAPEAPTDSSAG